VKLYQFSKSVLLLGSAICLTACSDNSSVDTSTVATKSAVSETNKKRPYKMISYDAAGQTDADHLYLEEVLGEAALDQVKSWNKRSLTALKADPRYQTLEEVYAGLIFVRQHSLGDGS